MGNFIVRQYSFVFHLYLTTNFHLNIFFAGNYISVLFATWNDVSIYFVSNISRYLFIFCGCLCYARKKPQYFTFTVRKSFTYSHLTKVHAFFYKILDKFNNDLYLWKSEITNIKKGKIFNKINSIKKSIFLKMFLQSLIPTCAIHCKSHYFLISFCFESAHFSKNVIFGKIHFVILFWTRSPIVIFIKILVFDRFFGNNKSKCALLQ